MQYFSDNPGHTTGSFSLFTNRLYSIFNSKNLGLATAGAFVVSGGLATGQPTESVDPALYQSAAANDANGQYNSESTSHSASVDIHTYTSAGPSNSIVHATVNGQTVIIPKNSSQQQTIINADGSQTTINVSGTTTVTSTGFNMDVRSSGRPGGSAAIH